MTKKKNEKVNNKKKQKMKNRSLKKIKKESKNKNKQSKKNIIKQNKSDNNICIICYSEPTKIIKLKCNHILCDECYHKWCKIKETCPMCRRKMYNTPSEDPDFENILRSLYDNRSFLFQKSY